MQAIKNWRRNGLEMRLYLYTASDQKLEAERPVNEARLYHYHGGHIICYLIELHQQTKQQ